MINATGNRMTREIARQSKLAEQIEKLQIQVSTGKRLQRMSDDVVASKRIATIGKTQAAMDTWATNINTGKALASQADGALQSAGDLLARARELTLTASSDTTSAADRSTIAAELSAIADQLDGLAATRDSNGEPLFSAGNARVMRFDSDTVFAPVPSAADAFAVGGTSLSTFARDAAAAVTAGDKTAMGSALTAFDTAIAHTADQNAAVGLAAGRLERIGDSLAARGVTLADERSSVEDTDLSVAIAQLNAADLTLSAAQAAYAKINRQSLFDLLS